MPTATDLVSSFTPETEVEAALAADPELIAGLAWGRPRAGHPEGSVGVHVSHLLETLDREGVSGDERELLRFLSLVHDAFKYRVHEWRPKAGGNHHAARARRFAERYTDDERLLATLELHDRPYNLWRKLRRTGTSDDPAFDEMLSRIPDPQLFLRFIELDGSTEGKDPEPLRWFRQELERRGLLTDAEARRSSPG